MEVEPITLDGKRIKIETMRSDHLDALAAAGGFAELWRWTTTRADTRELMETYMNTALRDAEAGVSLPFVTVDKASARIIGSTRFGNIDPHNRRAEIGWTWITPEFQRTHVNSEAKYLMLRHAFEVWNCIRVELKTDVLNSKSRNAMLRMGATEEGVLRQHQIMYDGRYRDTIYYSVLDREWPEVREKLLGFISREQVHT